MLRLNLWLSYKLLFSKKSLLAGSSIVAFMGLILGVGILVLSMAIMSGFETTLREAMSDVTGHVQIIFRKSNIDDVMDWKTLHSKIQKEDMRVMHSTPFLLVEGVLPRNGKISGVLIEGVDEKQYTQVLNFKNRMVTGTDSLLDSGKQAIQNKLIGVLIGKGMAEQFKLNVGDSFKVVVPVAQSDDASQFKRNIGSFFVKGILDLGTHDWNERFIIMPISELQKLAEVGSRYSGIMVKTNNIYNAQDVSFNLSKNLGARFWIRDWHDLNQNLFDAVKLERVVIFLVVCILVIVAAFNISSSLLINILKRYPDIAILKSLGMRSKSIMQIFSMQGILIGFIGVLGGVLLGRVLCYFFTQIQKYFHLIDGTVYRLDKIILDVRNIDIVAITISTLLICFVATLWPARRGSKLQPSEGLRYG